jgi:hypothetical protein
MRLDKKTMNLISAEIRPNCRMRNPRESLLYFGLADIYIAENMLLLPKVALDDTPQGYRPLNRF